MGLREVKKELGNAEKEELIGHLLELYKKYKPVKAYLDFYAWPDQETLIQKQKDQIEKCFFGYKSRRPKIAKAKRVITDSRKLGITPEAEAELRMHYIECAIRFEEIRSVYNQFFDSVLKSYKEALAFMEKHELLPHFRKRNKALFENVVDNGYGFYSEMIAVMKVAYAD